MKTSNFDFQCDLSPVILWQYLDAEKLRGLVAMQQEFLDVAVRDFIDEFNKTFLNISTATGNGLALWGRLLNVGRPVVDNGDGTVTEFTDEQYRTVLRGQIYLLAFDGSVKALNRFFKILFPNLPIVIVDNLDMTVDFNVLRDADEIEPWERTLLNYLFTPTGATGGVRSYAISLPRPSGVKYNLNFNVDYSKIFGFEGQTYKTEQNTDESLQGFDNGTFFQ